jgi:hypothetical protein
VILVMVGLLWCDRFTIGSGSRLLFAGISTFFA